MGPALTPVSTAVPRNVQLEAASKLLVRTQRGVLQRELKSLIEVHMTLHQDHPTIIQRMEQVHHWTCEHVEEMIRHGVTEAGTAVLYRSPMY